MSAKSRQKYQQAQNYQHGFKPQIPDASDEDSLVEFTETETGQNTANDSEVEDSEIVSGKKRGIFAFLWSWSVLILTVPFRFTRRVTGLVFTKAKKLQKSYLESITAEGPKEDTTLFSQNCESNLEKKPLPESPILAEQIEATSRQLTELHRSPTPVQKVNEMVEEEEPFSSDDFDEAVRKARMKLVWAAALVFVCVGGFFAYQFASSHLSGEKGVASDEPNAGEASALQKTEPDMFETGRSAEQLAGMPNINVPQLDSFNTQVEPSFDDSPEAPWGLAETDFSLLDDDEPQDFALPESMIADHTELPSTLLFNPAQSLSLSASADSRNTTPQTMQGETQGAIITIPRSQATGLPLPNTDSRQAQRSNPAAQFAGQYQEDDEDQDDLNLFDDEPFVSTMAAPNRRYQDDAAVQTSASDVRRQRTLPFGQTQSQTQPLASTVKTTAQSDSRRYVVQDGDNLYNIAKRELGDVTRWREIFRLNRNTIGANVGYLTPGTVISMPE